MAHSEPQVVYLRDYKKPSHQIEQVKLEFTLKEELTVVNSSLTLSSDEANQDLILQGENLELISVSLNGKKLEANAYQVTPETLTIFKTPKQFTLDIVTHIKPQENTALSGLYKSSGNFCTQCEAQGFRRITYYLDRPDVMARFTTKITADKKRYPLLLSNGNLVKKGEGSDGTHWVEWVDPFKKPCYLFALVAGDFDCLDDIFQTQSGRKVVLKIFVEKGNLDKCDHAMQAVKKAMRWDEEKYGREYDLDIYMIVAVSDFNMGAMENKGLNVFNTQYVLAKAETATDQDFINIESVIAHEYFHNWTGNRITCRDWFQLSLKEGLTIFRDQNFTADTTSKAVARINDVNDLRNSQFPEDASPVAHPVRPDSYMEINNFYTATIYNKGAEVIRMMLTLLGETTFRKGMDLYFERHDGQAVTIEEFVKAMEDAGKIDLKQFRLWYSQAGTPVLDISEKYANQTYELTIKQTCPPTPDQPTKQALHIPIQLGLLTEEGKLVSQNLLQLKTAEQTFKFENISAKPIPSLLRGFSAPVKVNFPYRDHDLKILLQYDDDLFNRWEAGQKYAIKLILDMIKDYRAKKPLTVASDYLTALTHLVKTLQNDKLLLAELLILPTEKYLAEQMTEIDPDAIHVAREALQLAIAKHLETEFLEIYQQNHSEPALPFSMNELGKRQLKNQCLYYLMQLNKPIYTDMCLKQFKQNLGHNMTETLSAMRPLTERDGPEREVALEQFYQHWQNDILSVDKWFSMQAISKMPHTWQQVKKLLQHPAFDIKNPNKVYSLIGGFALRNQYGFHQVSGEGYNLLTDCVLQLNRLNPQVAARMVKSLITWRRFDSERQNLMRQQLQRIMQEKTLSNDVYELVSKSLA